MNQELQACPDEELLVEREVNINKLARGVEEISELFLRGNCVRDGFPLTNINNSLSDVNKANVELRKAEK